MSKCAKYHALISAYVDGELDRPGVMRVEKHLGTCGDCSAIHKLYRGISVATQASLIETPAALRDGVMHKVRNGGVVRMEDFSRRRRVTRLVLTRFVPVAACIAVILLVLPFAINLQRSADDAINESPDFALSGDADGASIAETAPMMPAPSSSGNTGAVLENEVEAGVAPPAGGAGVDSGLPGPGGEGTVEDSNDTSGMVSSPDEAPVIDAEEPGDDEAFDVSPGTGGDRVDTGFQDEHYYVVIEISGDLPVSLANHIGLFVDDLTLHYYIQRDDVQDLIEELGGRSDITISAMDLRGEVALVIYSRVPR